MSDPRNLQIAERGTSRDITSAPPRRLTSIDAARGLVMMFSCLSHFAWWIHAVYPQASDTLSAAGMVATPSFLLISGSMIGLLAASSMRTERLEQQFFNRGLFLLTIGHILISLAETHDRLDFIAKLKGATIIDEIGLATLLASCFIHRLRSASWARGIAIAGTAIFATCWILNLYWLPDAPTLMALKQILIGGGLAEPPLDIYTAPTLQYLAIYSMGLPIGHVLAGAMGSDAGRIRIARRAVTLGMSLAVGALMLHLSWKVLAPHVGLTWAPDIQSTLRITAKHPPSPIYLLFFAGCGMTFTGVLIGLAERRWLLTTRITDWLATIGRASFFVFVLQYFLYWTLPSWFGLDVNAWCPVVFVGNVLLMYYAARVWLRHDGNRWMTFGIVLPMRSAVTKR